jgi:hypothetical protein
MVNIIRNESSIQKQEAEDFNRSLATSTDGSTKSLHGLEGKLYAYPVRSSDESLTLKIALQARLKVGGTCPHAFCLGAYREF